MVLKEERNYMKIIFMKTELAIAHRGSPGFDWMGNMRAISQLKVDLFSFVHFLSLVDSLTLVHFLDLVHFLCLVHSLNKQQTKLANDTKATFFGGSEFRETFFTPPNEADLPREPNSCPFKVDQTVHV